MMKKRPDMITLKRYQNFLLYWECSREIGMERKEDEMTSEENRLSNLKKFILFLIILAVVFVAIDCYRHFDLVVEGYRSTRVVPEERN